MTRFENTTQSKYWLFTKEKQKQIRIHTNQEASKRLKDRIVSEEAIGALTVEEESKLRRIYEIQIQRSAEKLQLLATVQATAVTLFKRYFLKKSVMESDLSTVSITCLYLATKIEEYYVPFADFIHILEANITVDQLLVFELEILQELSFQITCVHPYRSFSALWSICEDWLNSQKLTVDKGKLYDQTYSLLHRTLLTDLMFYLTPGQIAMGVLSLVCSKHKLSLPLYLLLTFKDSPVDKEEWSKVWEDCMVDVRGELNTCGGMGSWTISDEEKEQLLKRLGSCRDPRMDPNSKEYHEMKKRIEMEKDMKRQEKNRLFAEKRRREFAMITGMMDEKPTVRNSQNNEEKQETPLEKETEEYSYEEKTKKRKTINSVD
eukprot:jgi/Galph1/3466/GphlegSOOS_G2125.1